MKFNILFNTMDATLCFVADELKHYLYEMDQHSMITFNDSLDQAFSITLSIKPTLGTSSNDTYHIYSTPNQLYLHGSNSRSVLLASYKFLYLLGCRFLQPGKNFEHIPKCSLNQLLSTFTHDQTYTASFQHRGVCIEGANSIENVLDFIDWLPKLGYNSFFMQFKSPYTFFERWYHHTLNPLLEKSPLTIEQVQLFDTHIQSELKKRDLIYHKVGHGWTCETLDVKDLGWQKTSSKLDSSKEDWVALVDGKRELFGGIATNTNLCYANSAAKQTFIKNIVDYATSHPQVDYLHIWLADEFNNLCECPQCKNTLLSDQYIEILNILDDQLTQLNSPTKIVFLIYQELLWPPLHTTFNNHHRFTLMFAPISRTFEKSYKDCSISDAIPTYNRNKITLPSSLEENLSFLSQWQKKWHGDSFVYDYPLGRAHYGDVGYMNISKIIHQDIQHLKQLNLNGYMSCQELRVSFPHALPNYIMGLTLFDCSTDFDTTAEDYFLHMYGEGTFDYHSYLQLLSKYSSCDYFNGIGERLSEAHAMHYLNLKQHAESFLTTASADTHNYFIKKLITHAKYVVHLSSALYHLSTGDVSSANQNYRSLLQFIRSNEESIQESLDVYRVIEVSGKYTGFSESH